MEGKGRDDVSGELLGGKWKGPSKKGHQIIDGEQRAAGQAWARFANKSEGWVGAAVNWA